MMCDRVEYNKKYRLNNQEYFRLKNREFHQLNKDEISEKKRKYYIENKDKIREQKRNYYLSNKKILNMLSVERVNARKKNDVSFKLKSNIRGLIASSLKLKGVRKKSKTIDILGCSFDEFKNYLESKFEPWMNWNNYGNWNGCPIEIETSWDIDHIIPLSTAKDEKDVIILNHFTNLQPLCSYTNRHIKAGNYENY